MPTKKARITDDDVKSESDLIDLGADKTKLISAAKIYVSLFGKTLLQAILDGDLNGGGGSMPFPSTIVTGTGAYTIPSGFNARVTVNCQNGEQFQVNSAVVLSSQNLDLERVSLTSSRTAPTSSATASNPVSPDRYFLGNAYASAVQANINVNGFASINNDGLTTDSASTGSPNPAVNPVAVFRQNLVVGPGGTASASTSAPTPSPQASQRGSGTAIVSGVEIGKQNTNVSASYLLPPSTLIDGGRYVVELYPV